ncbi:MAG: hypothetical protein ACRDMX_04645, partial [Solirubrobacteraceae bacterium]
MMRGDQLTFTIGLPPYWGSVDLLEPGNGTQLGAELSESLGIAARGSDQARVLMLRSLMAISSAREPLAAGL